MTLQEVQRQAARFRQMVDRNNMEEDITEQCDEWAEIDDARGSWILGVMEAIAEGSITGGTAQEFAAAALKAYGD